jgi:hypothetical protein
MDASNKIVICKLLKKYSSIQANFKCPIMRMLKDKNKTFSFVMETIKQLVVSPKIIVDN